MDNALIVKFEKDYVEIIRSVRNKVFTQEQGIDETADFDGQDPEAIHAIVKVDGRPVGTARMLKDGHIGRLAVLKDQRGKGFGKELLNALISRAAELGLKRAYLGAQMDAVEFYRKNGFKEVGDPYEEVGIRHIIMEKKL